MLQP